VRRGVKVVIWTGVFVACAGAGAYVAAHTNPFPPGVEDPGARPTSPPPTSPVPAAQRWSLGMVTTSFHQLHVGGRCRSAWDTSGAVTIGPDGAASGHARAKLIPAPQVCDFPIAQVQTKIIDLTVTGRRTGNRLVLRFSIAGRSPTGSNDLGGFEETLRLVIPKVNLGSESPSAAARAKKSDGDLGFYASESGIHMDCSGGC
jgi:hypothetical protein